MTNESASQLSLEIERQIHQILSSNRVSDLNKFLDKRRNLNRANQILNYSFYFIQSSSIVLTSIGQAYSNPYCIWSGVVLSSLSAVIHHWESTNTRISKILLKNIKSIKDNTYIDEITFELDNEIAKHKSNSQSNIIINNSGTNSIV
jgi:hypothetical protein